MLEKLTYINHIGEKLEFGKNNLFVNENSLRDFVWNITNINDRISGFKKGIVSKTIPIVLKCQSESDGIEMRNRLFEVFEKDVLAVKHGKFQIGEFYLNCYVTALKKTQYLIHKSYMVITATVETDKPMWVKESTMSFVLQDENVSQPHLDYPYNYNHDFKKDSAQKIITNTSLTPSDFILTFFGYAQNPYLEIGGNIYWLHVVVEDGERLVVNSIEKTITLIKADGQKVNYFHTRGMGGYIFEKIPVGVNDVSSPNPGLHFTITLLEERGEPKWI